MQVWLERHQIALYFIAISVGWVTGLTLGDSETLRAWINPALALMLLVTFLQIPLTELRQALTHRRFLLALGLANFVLVPLLVSILALFLPQDPMVRLGVLLVLLAPCIDYVVAFTHLGRGDARLLLAATPFLLLMQMLLLPLYLHGLLGPSVALGWQPEPFIRAFIGLIVLPLLLAALMQWWGKRHSAGMTLLRICGKLPVPMTMWVLWMVVATAIPHLESVVSVIWVVLPFYLVFAVFAPLLGWWTGRGLKLDTAACRTLAFSTATRNSLVLLPLVFAVPGAIPLLPALIMAQTLVELCCELIYMRLLAR